MPNSSWSVTSQNPATRPDRTGRVVPGYDIYFTTSGGHSGSIFVPNAQFTPESVKPLLQLAANNLDAIGNLSSE